MLDIYIAINKRLCIPGLKLHGTKLHYLAWAITRAVVKEPTCLYWLSVAIVSKLAVDGSVDDGRGLMK